MNFEHVLIGTTVYVRHGKMKLTIIDKTKKYLVTNDGRRWKKENGRQKGLQANYIEI